MDSTETKILNKIKEEKEKRHQILSMGLREEANLLPISQAVDAYFCFNKLKVYCEYLSFQKIVGTTKLAYEKDAFFLLEASLKKMEADYLDQEIVFQIYWKIKGLGGMEPEY